MQRTHTPTQLYNVCPLFFDDVLLHISFASLLNLNLLKPLCEDDLPLLTYNSKGWRPGRTIPKDQHRNSHLGLFLKWRGQQIRHHDLFFHPPARRGLRGHPYNVLQGARHRRRRGLMFSVRVVKYWNKLSAWVVPFSRNGWRTFGQKSFPISPH